MYYKNLILLNSIDDKFSQNLFKCHINYKTNTFLGNIVPTCEFTFTSKRSGIHAIHF